MNPLDTCIPLLRLTHGTPAQIVSLEGGRTFQRRMRSMGLREGAVVEVFANQPLHGPLVICLGGRKLTVGRGMANRIIVRHLE